MGSGGYSTGAAYFDLRGKKSAARRGEAMSAGHKRR